ncbi:MAG: hypothetical protein WC306_03510 [Candidatus Paceibacterota bacterium]|jgi:hypothetical protein
MADMNLELFAGKTFSSLLQDIYKNSTDKKTQINKLISQLSPLVTNATEAAVIVPMIAEYLDVAVKNDEQLVKMAGIVQRLINAETSSNTSELISESEREALMKQAEEEIKKIKAASKEIDSKLTEVSKLEDKV